LAVDTPVKLIKDFSYAEGSFFWVMNNIYFQYYSLIIFLVCIGVMVLVSYLTEEPAYSKINGLTYETLTDEDRRTSRASWNKMGCDCFRRCSGCDIGRVFVFPRLGFIERV
jgi:SSS family solute:Na+ symporter